LPEEIEWTFTEIKGFKDHALPLRRNLSSATQIRQNAEEIATHVPKRVYPLDRPYIGKRIIREELGGYELMECHHVCFSQDQPIYPERKEFKSCCGVHRLSAAGAGVMHKQTLLDWLRPERVPA